MAFEAYLAQNKSKPRIARAVTGTVAITVHGALIVAGIIYSFWHVEVLSPPTVMVTFLQAAPPPPPPPPPKRKAVTKSKPVTPKEVVQPRANQIVQPRVKEERVEKEEKDDGVEGGVEGGIAGGVAPAPPPPPKIDTGTPRMVSPGVASTQWLTDPGKDPKYRPIIPEQFNRPGVRMFALIKICVSREGDVASVKIVKSMDPAIDPLLTAKAMTWKYRPITIDGNAVPFCYSLRYDHQVQ
jgi:periplasmic protein TonB